MGRIDPKACESKSGRPFTIRCGEPDEALRLLEYIRAVAKTTSFFIMEPDEFGFTEQQERDWIADHAESPGKILLLAEAAGEIIGTLTSENSERRRLAHHSELGISVVQSWRGEGVGTALMEAAIAWAEQNPVVEKLRLSVFATNTVAQGLYRKLGFVEYGRAPKEVKIAPGEYVDTIFMHRFV